MCAIHSCQTLINGHFFGRPNEKKGVIVLACWLTLAICLPTKDVYTARVPSSAGDYKTGERR